MAETRLQSDNRGVVGAVKSRETPRVDSSSPEFPRYFTGLRAHETLSSYVTDDESRHECPCGI